MEEREKESEMEVQRRKGKKRDAHCFKRGDALS